MPPTLEADHINYPLEVRTPGYIVTASTRRAIEQQRYLPFRPSLVGINHVKVTRPISYPPHVHADYEIVFVEAGPYHCRLNQHPVEVAAGEALIISPDDTHEVELRAGQNHQILHFQLLDPSTNAPAPVPILAPTSSPVANVFEAPGAMFGPLLQSIRDEQDQQAPFSTQIQDSLLQTLFWRALNQLDPGTLSASFQQQSADQSFIQKLFAVIEANMHRKLVITEVARDLNMGRSSLTKRCQSLLGAPPSKIFARAKISHAALLLSQPETSVKEVSYQLGFQNQYHFSRVFKSVMGYPPSAARHQSSETADPDRGTGN